MTAIDIGIIAFTALMAAVGWRQGFLVGVLSLAGFAGGALLGTRLGGLVVSGGSSSPYAPLFGLVGAVAVGGLLAIAFEGLGLVLRAKVARSQGLERADGALGAVLLAALALGMSWLAGAVALQTPGARDLRPDIQRSSILRRLNDVLPPSGALLNALARFDPIPAINGPQTRVSPPPPGVPRDPDVRRAAASVVRITGSACGLGVEGSGWVVAPGLVVTNAHVVAGEDDTVVQVRGTGTKHAATAVGFDTRNDIAILRVAGIDGVPALPFAPVAPRGRPAAILGFPRNGPYDVRAARLDSTEDVISQDAYGRGPVKRKIMTVRGHVRPGNSGGPVVDKKGRVAATVFASSASSGPRTGYGIPNELVQRVLATARGRVSTGDCAP